MTETKPASPVPNRQRGNKLKLQPGTTIILKAEAWQEGCYRPAEFTFVLTVVEKPTRTVTRPASPTATEGSPRHGSGGSDASSSELAGGGGATDGRPVLPGLEAKKTLEEAVLTMWGSLATLPASFCTGKMLRWHRDWAVSQTKKDAEAKKDAEVAKEKKERRQRLEALLNSEVQVPTEDHRYACRASQCASQCAVP